MRLARGADRPARGFVEVPGDAHLFWVGDQDALLDEVERFVAGLEVEEAELERFLATVLFTDIVGSTERAARARRPGAGRSSSRRITPGCAASSARYRAPGVDTAGDGFFATFDGPARAIRCAPAIVESVRGLGLAVRAGLHTGECELIAGKVGGIAVAIGARVADRAGPGEVLGLADREGPGRRLRARLRGSGRARAQGRAGPLAAPPGGGLT